MGSCRLAATWPIVGAAAPAGAEDSVSRWRAREMGMTARSLACVGAVIAARGGPLSGGLHSGNVSDSATLDRIGLTSSKVVSAL